MRYGRIYNLYVRCYILTEIVNLIWDSWNNGRVIPKIPNHALPQTRKEAYAIQSDYCSKSKYPCFGWKIAATSLAGQQHIGVTSPIAGRLLKERVFSPNSSLLFGSNRMAVAEPEFAFKMKKTLFARKEEYKREEVILAVDTLHLAVEIPDSRFEDFSTVGAIQLIIDNACAHELVIGPPVKSDWKHKELSKHNVTISTHGGCSNLGNGSNVLGDPRTALTWLVNELSKNNINLMAGETVTTGTCTIPIAIQKNDIITADFGTLGAIQLSLC